MSNSSQNQDSLEEKLKAAFESDNSDKNYNALKAVVNSVPAVGSLVAGFIDSYIVPPATQRMRNFLEALVGGCISVLQIHEKIAKMKKLVKS
jgi:hypothetical protein